MLKPVIPIWQETCTPLQDQMHRLVAVGVLVMLERMCACLAGGASSFPPPLIGMVSLFVAFLALDALGGGAADVLFWLLEPGYRFLLKWAPLFFIPSLVRLPLMEIHFSMSAAFRIGLLLGIGTIMQMFIVASCARSFQHRAPKADILDDRHRPPHERAAPRYPRPGRPYRRRWLFVYAAGIVVSLTVGRMQKMQRLAETVFLLSASLTAFVAGNNSPLSLRRLLHPIFAGVIGTWLATLVWTSYLTNGHRFCDVVNRYSSSTGAGALLSTLLGPLVVALALLLYERRQLLSRDCVPILFVAVVGAISGLFGSAMLARVLSVPRIVAVASVSRFCTAPLAVSVATSMGASQPLSVGLVVVSGFLGVLFGRPLLGALHVHDPRGRGLSTGAISHVLGTVSLASWDEAAVPYSALAFVLTSGVTAALAGLPLVQVALLRILP